MYRTGDFRRKKMALIKKYMKQLQERYDVWGKWTYRNEGKELTRWMYDRYCNCKWCLKGRTHSRLREKEEERYNFVEDME